jgi:ABC-type phosphate transport system substrate-binding protein
MKLKCTFMALLLLAPICSQAEVKVVVHPNTTDTALSQSQAGKIFLGKVKELPSGYKIFPLDQEDEEVVKEEFYSKATNKKKVSQLKSYWARLVFTGKGRPPQTVMDDDEVLEFVSENPNMMGYVSGEADTSDVKVILTIP